MGITLAEHRKKKKIKQIHSIKKIKKNGMHHF